MFFSSLALAMQISIFVLAAEEWAISSKFLLKKSANLAGESTQLVKYILYKIYASKLECFEKKTIFNRKVSR